MIGISEHIKIIEDIKALGAATAAYLDVSSIKFSEQFRDMCKQNHCGAYGKNYMCPPYIGELDECVAKIKGYDYGYVFQTIHNIEDSYDFEGMEDGSRLHEENLRRIIDYINQVKEDYDKENKDTKMEIMFLGAGGCRICSKCGILTNAPCRFPDKAISSLEGHCIDVADITISHGLNYINGVNTVSYVGLVLIRVKN